MEQIISPADALPGRREAMVIGQQHAVNGNPTQGPWPEGMAVAWFGRRRRTTRCFTKAIRAGPVWPLVVMRKNATSLLAMFRLFPLVKNGLGETAVLDSSNRPSLIANGLPLVRRCISICVIPGSSEVFQMSKLLFFRLATENE